MIEDPIVIKRMSPELLPAYLDFFDRSAFDRHPEWSGCYCNCYYADCRVKPWKDWRASENRRAVADRIKQGRMHGHLAFLRERPVGWCGAGPKTAIPALVEASEDKQNEIGAITCFVVAQKFRRQGVARALLRSVLRDFVDLNLTIAEAYPRPNAESDAANHFGPLALYYAEGFSFYQNDPTDGSIVVRKALGQAY